MKNEMISHKDFEASFIKTHKSLCFGVRSSNIYRRNKSFFVVLHAYPQFLFIKELREAIKHTQERFKNVSVRNKPDTELFCADWEHFLSRQEMYDKQNTEILTNVRTTYGGQGIFDLK